MSHVLNSFDENNFFFSDITYIDILETLAQIKTNAIGPDSISIAMIKFSLPVIFPVFLHIYNSLSKLVNSLIYGKLALYDLYPKLRIQKHPVTLEQYLSFVLCQSR